VLRGMVMARARYGAYELTPVELGAPSKRSSFHLNEIVIGTDSGCGPRLPARAIRPARCARELAPCLRFAATHP